MATHSSVLAWRTPGTGEPGRLPSMGSHRVRHNWSDLAVAVAGKNTGVGCLFLLQGIFPTQGVSLALPHCRPTPYRLSCQAMTMLNRNNESRHFCFSPHFRGETFSFSLFNIMFLDLSFMALFMLRCIQLYPVCWEFLSMFTEFRQTLFLHLLRLSWI